MELLEEKLDPSFVIELNNVLQNYDTYLEKKNIYINYVNLYHKNLDLRKYDYLIDYFKQIEPIKKDLENKKILNFGFIMSQPGCETQPFHLDYDGKSDTYFIPLCDLSNKNGTEFLYFFDKENYNKYFDTLLKIKDQFLDGKDLIKYFIDLNLIYGKDFELRIANANAYDIIKMPYYTLHRGKINETDNIRIMFQLVFENELIDYIQNTEFVENSYEDENDN